MHSYTCVARRNSMWLARIFQTLLLASAAFGQDAFLPDTPAVEKALTEVLPIVEQTQQRTFREPPRILLVESSEMETHAEARYRAQRQSPKVGADPNLQIIAELLLPVMSLNSLIAAYSPERRAILLCPSTFTKSMTRHKVPLAEQRNVLKLVVAHELVHALQDREIGFDELLATMPDLDTAAAANLLFEGHAIVGHELVADKLGLVDAAAHLDRVVGGGSLLYEPITIDAASGNPRAWTDTLPKARELCRGLHAAGGAEAWWRRIGEAKAARAATPDADPRDARMVAALDGFEARFGRSWTKVETRGGAATGAASLFANLAVDKRDQAIACVQRVQSRIAIDRSAATPAVLNAFVFAADADQVRGLFDLVLEANEQNAEFVRRMAPTKRYERGMQEIEVPNSEQAKSCTVRSDLVNSKTIVARTSSYLVQVQATNFAADDKTLRTAMEEILKRLK